jgi:hypothetical protein
MLAGWRFRDFGRYGQPSRPPATVQPRAAPPFTGDALPGEDSSQRACAGCHALHGPCIAQFVQTDRRMRFVSCLDRIGLDLDGLRAPIAALRPRCDLSLLPHALRPAAGTRHADFEAGGGAMAGRASPSGSQQPARAD